MQRTATPTIEQVFAGRAASLRLFFLVRRYIESLGEVQVTPTKTQVSFGAKRKFAWVWLPQMWVKKQPKDSIVLAFGVKHRIVDDHIKESVEPYPRRFIHHVVIERQSDLNAKVKKWLREAYEFGKMPR